MDKKPGAMITEIFTGKMVMALFGQILKLDTVIGYIAKSAPTSPKKTFQDEYRFFFKKYKVEYDDRYVWD